MAFSPALHCKDFILRVFYLTVGDPATEGILSNTQLAKSCRFSAFVIQSTKLIPINAV